jgi:hypothetical protein
MDNNGFDWVAVQMQTGGNSNATSLDAIGVDPSTTTLQAPDFYKSKAKIQDMFKDSNGLFDNTKFDSFYHNMEKSFNQYKQTDTSLGNATTDLYNDTSITRALNLPIRRNPVEISLPSLEPFTNLKTAQNSFYGLTEINKWSDPKKSIAQVAKEQNVMDSVTGKSLNYTPQDTGLFNLYGFLSEPLVLASYDKDVKDEKGRVTHKAGETKYDDKGLPFYETLAGRDPSGKETLSRWNTLTKDDSFMDKFDFMKSDGLNKSITGSVVKAAVQYAPMLIPGLNTAYAAYTIGSGLVDGGTEIAKAIDGIINGPDAKNDSLYKWANELQGYAGQLKGSQSQHAKDNWWDLENLLNMAVDSVYILKSQNAIVQWPTEFAKYQMAKQLGIETESAINVGKEATDALGDITKYAEKYGSDWVKSAQMMAENQQKIQTYAKYAGHMSTAYMAATSAAAISNMADKAGIDARDKGFLYLGYTAALIPFFNTQLGHWVNTKIGGLDEFTGALNNTLVDRGADMFPEISKELDSKISSTTTKGQAMKMLAAGKELATRIIGGIKGSSPSAFINAGIANSVDMTSIKAINDGLQVVYNGLASAGFKSTQQDAKFDVSPTSIAKDLLSEVGSGFMGGAMFHLAHLATGSSDHAFKSDKLYEYSLEGYSQQVQETIKSMKTKGQLGSTTLSVNPLLDDNGIPVDGMYKAVNKDNPISQNDFIADRLSKTMKVYDGLKEAYNMVSPNVTAEGKTKYYAGIVDSKTDTDLPLQLRDTMKELFKVGVDIQSTEELKKESEDDSLLEKKAKLKLLKDKLEYLQGDESLDEFFIQGLFNIRPDINSRFGVKNRETMAVELAGKPYKELTQGQQTKVDAMYNEYRNDAGQTGLMADLQKGRAEYHHFQEIMEHRGHYEEINAFRESIQHLNKYITTYQAPYLPDGEERPVAMGITYQLTQDYLQRLQGVKYIPDYIFDKVKTAIGETASQESDEVLKALTVNHVEMKHRVNAALKGDMPNGLIQDYVKKLIGDNQFNELTSSDEYKDISNNAVPETNYSTLHMLRSLAELHNNINEPKLAQQRQIIQSLSSVDAEELSDKLYAYDTGEIDKNDPFLAQFSHIDGLFDHIDSLREQGLDDQAWSHLFTEDGLNRFVLTNHIEKKLGIALTEEQKSDMYDNLKLNNIYTSMLIDGKYDVGGEDIHVHTINNLDDSTIHQSMELLKNFDKERVASPMRDNLQKEYEFLEDQIENLNTVGVANYLNADQGFIDQLDSKIKAVERVAALIESTATVNPIINDFRANHKGMLSDVHKDIVLSVLDEPDKNTLFHEIGRMHQQLKYLKDVNNYNVNNQLARLLREDGYEVVSKVKALRDIAQDPRVKELLPSLGTIFSNDAINNYHDTYKTASDDEKFNALHEMAKLENNIYEDVKKLANAEVIELANHTFKPVNAASPDFYSPIDPRESLNDNHRTLYLASIYGASTTDFYHRYAGTYDNDAEGFTNLNKSPYIPFAKQESAVRTANLIINGDRNITKLLFNAFSYGDTSDEVDFSKPAYDGFDSSHLLAILGSPGTGKTTSVLYNIMNMIPDVDGNTIILAPKSRQLGALENALVKGDFQHRIDERSDTVRNFLKSLSLKNKDGSDFDFTHNDEALTHTGNGSDDISIRENFNSFLNTPASNDNLSGMIDKLDLYQRKKLNPSIINYFSKTKLIALDEFTHVNPIDVAILNKIVNEYNNSDIVTKDPSKQISIMIFGDENQLGYTDTSRGVRRDFTAVANTIQTQPLLISLRSGWDVVNNTLVDITRRTINIKNIASVNSAALNSTVVLQESKNNPIKLFNYTGEDGSKGIKMVRVEGETKASDLSFISDNKGRTYLEKDGSATPIAGKDIVYVVNSIDEIPKAQALLRDAFGLDWSEKANIEIYTPDEVQGGEYKYAIIGAQPKISGSANTYDIVRTYEFLNTMLSRASEATLLIDNGSMDRYVKFENSQKDRAINQLKITDKVIKDVKSNKQRLLAAILGSDYVPEGAKPGSIVDAPSKKEIAVKPIKKVIFDDIKPEVTNTNLKVSNITAYTTFLTKLDFDKVRKLSRVELGATDAKVENILNSLKYYLVKGREIGEGNVAVASNFMPYLSDYNYDSPKFFIEAGKRTDDNTPQDRAGLNPAPNPPREAILLKVGLDSNVGEESLELTLGALNSIDQLQKKFKNARNIDDVDRKVNKFVGQLSDFISDPNKHLDWGTTDNQTWRSRDFSAKEWRNMTTQWSSRLFYDDTSSFSLNKFRKLYPDFHISDPQVVVASLKDDEGKPILDADGTNPQYKKYWEDLKGKSIVFMSEYKELQSLSPDELLDVYIKQLSLFSTPEFKSADSAGKQAIIDGVTDRINIDNRFSLPYKPNMVKMIRLDNPRDSFINFRERYLISIAQHKEGTPIQQLFEKFDMTPYVKDRLAKSLLTIRQFLMDGKDNQDFFVKNILSKQNDNAENRIADIRQQALDRFGETIDMDQDFSRHDNFNEVVLDAMGKIASPQEFIDKLNDLLEVNKEKSIFLSKYETKANADKVTSARIDRNVPLPVTSDDLKLNLTSNKQLDFSNSILDLNLLNLFKQTKNLNFAELIDESLKAFSKFPQEDKRFDKYRLDSVFKDGEIETMVVAQRAALKGNNANNILADVKHIGDTYKFGFKQLQTAAYNIDFGKLLDQMTVEQPEINQDLVNNAQSDMEAKVNKLAGKLPQEWLRSKFGALDDAVVNTTNLEEKYEAIQKFDDALSSLNETVQVPSHSDPLTTDTEVAYDVSPNGITATHTVESDTRKGLIENYSEFKKLTHDEITLEPLESDKETAKFLVKTEDGEFKVTYNAKDRSIDLSRLESEDPNKILEVFEEQSGDGEKDPQKILDMTLDDVGKKFLKDNPHGISTIDKLKEEVGKALHDNLSDPQTDAIIGHEWRDNKGYYNDGEYTHDFYKNLADNFLDKFTDDKDKVYEQMLKTVHDTAEYFNMNSLGVAGEDAPEPVFDKFSDLKTKKEYNPMDKLKQDVRDENDKSKREFEYKVRELFKGSQDEDIVKDIIKNFELKHRYAVLDKKIVASGLNTNLTDLGVASDIALIDPIKIGDEIQDDLNKYPDIRKKYKEAFKALTAYTIEKIKTEC